MHKAMANKIEVENLTRKGAGRPKGSPNKTTKAAKDMLAEAADKLGGVARMVEWAKSAPENERMFWGTMFPKLLPVQVANADGETFKTEDTGAGAAKVAALLDAIAERSGKAG